MDRHNTPHEQHAQLSVEGELTIYTANDLRSQLLTHLETAAEIEINLSRVSDIDSAGLQILILAKREMLKREKNLRLVDHSKAVLDVFELCNLVSFFGDPLLISGSVLDKSANNGSAL